MNTLLLFAAATVLVNIGRFAALSWTNRQMSPSWEQFLRFLPIAVFTALVVSSLSREPETFSIKLIALAIAGGITWRTRHFGLSVLIGLGVLWILSGTGS